MSNQHNKEKEPRFSKAASDLLVNVIAGKDNTEVEPGNYKVQTLNIISGASYDVFVFLMTLKDMGYDTSKEIMSLGLPLVGCAKDFSEHGMRGEVENILTGNQVNSKNQSVNEGTELKLITQNKEEEK